MNDIFESVTTCRVCGASDLKQVLDLGAQPPANSLYKLGQTEPPSVPLRLLFCMSCSTVQLGETVQPNFLFSEYVWVTGTSQAARDHSEVLAKKTLNLVGRENLSVVEVASNDGTVLRRFKEAGCSVLGVDPAQNIAETATKSGIPTLAEFYTEDVARDIARSHGAADVVIARNVLPHVKAIHSVVKGMAEVLKDEGIAIAEFHDAGIIESELHYDSVYHEHLFYFTLTSMTRLFAQVGLYAIDVMRSPISGGSWVLFLSKNCSHDGEKVSDALEMERASGVDSLSTWQSFGNRVHDHAEQLKDVLVEVKSNIIGYGASARSSTLLNFCDIESPQVKAIIDRNPLKHGLLTPGTAIPIVSFEEGMTLLGVDEVVLLLSWNLKEEIIRDLRAEGFTGKTVIPLPNKPEIQ